MLNWLGGVPRLLSRPDILIQPCLRLGGGSEGALSEAAVLLPLATRRSIELAQGAGICCSDLDDLNPHELHVTEDLEAAVETIEHAQAKVGVRCMHAWEGCVYLHGRGKKGHACACMHMHAG